ncbi:hypothetical protein BpHYR1_024752 [Brachionus plicatilis]|uniref:Uncharacterized protein n=1 Tax=Brachionus plicatilis TaxID=10195 RepID=A0A3M7T5G2_BRAPC|nr:hypothetical protein BpHYR1_024752 [Brachionus plicatilis]
MNHPVLLPKRKEFGFLKPPQTQTNFKSSSIIRYTPGKRQEFITQTAKPVTLSQSIKTLRISYELKSASMVNPRQYEWNSESFRPEQKSDLKKEHFRRQAYVTDTGTNFKNLKKQHHVLSIYSIDNKKPKTADSIRSKNGYLRKGEKKNCGGTCVSCKFGKCIKLEEFVTLKAIKKPDDYDRIPTANSLAESRTRTRTANRSTFSDIFSRKSRKSAALSESTDIKTTENTYENSLYQRLDDEEDDDDIIPKLTLWLV